VVRRTAHAWSARSVLKFAPFSVCALRASVRHTEDHRSTGSTYRIRELHQLPSTNAITLEVAVALLLTGMCAGDTCGLAIAEKLLL
jgi:hypothetical protein